jgi:DNA-binding CsgD family transcriptional regulator
MIACALLAGACTFLEVLPEYLPSFVFPIAAAGTGVCTSAIAMRGASQISELRTKDALIALALTQLLGVFIYSFLSMLSDSGQHYLSLLFLCLLPLAAVCFSFCQSPEQPTESSEPFGSLPKSFKRLLVSVFVLCFVFSLIRGYFPGFMEAADFDRSRAVTALCIVGIMMAIVLVAAAKPADANFGSFAYSIFLIATVSVVFVPLFGIDNLFVGAFAVALLSVSFYAIWGVLACIAHKSGSSVLRVFGLGFGIGALGATVGVFIGDFLHTSPSVDEGTVATVGVLLVILSVLGVLIFLKKEDLQSLMLPASSEQPEYSRDDEKKDVAVKPRFRLRCQQIASREGLSPREAEVMIHMAKGKDAKAISEALFISFNTSRTHIRKVYTKLNIHNRSDFFALLDSEEYVEVGEEPQE